FPDSAHASRARGEDAIFVFFFFSSRRRHTRFSRDWSSDVCSSDLEQHGGDHSDRAAVRPVAQDQSEGDDHRRGQRVARSVAQQQIGRASCRERVERSAGGAVRKKKRGTETGERVLAGGGGGVGGQG